MTSRLSKIAPKERSRLAAHQLWRYAIGRRSIKSSNNRLVLVMPFTNDSSGFFEQSLSSVIGVVDAAVLIDDASTDDSARVASRVLGHEMPITLIGLRESLFPQEFRLRALAWRAAKVCQDADWILTLDSDQVLESGWRDQARDLVNQSEYDHVTAPLYDMWDETHYRDDSAWRLSSVRILSRAMNFFPEYWPRAELHSSNMPANIGYLPGIRSDLRIKHLGWSNPEERLRKARLYARLDPEAKWGSAQQYAAIFDSDIDLKEWKDRPMPTCG